MNDGESWIFSEHWDYKTIEKRHQETNLRIDEVISLREIKQKLLTSGSFSREEGTEVIEYLQKIIQKLNRIITLSKQENKSTGDLEKELKQIMDLYNKIVKQVGV